MDYNKLEAAREKFKKAEKTGYYNSRWFAVSDLFDALLEPAEPKEIFQEVPRRAECAFCLDESGSYSCIRPAHSAYQAKGDGSIDRATDGRITEEPVAVLSQEILADGCESDPADDGPEVKILHKKENHGHKS